MPNTQVVYQAIADFTRLRKEIDDTQAAIARLQAQQEALNASSTKGSAQAAAGDRAHTQTVLDDAKAEAVRSAAVASSTNALSKLQTAQKATESTGLAGTTSSIAAEVKRTAAIQTSQKAELVRASAVRSSTQALTQYQVVQKAVTAAETGGSASAVGAEKLRAAAIDASSKAELVRSDAVRSSASVMALEVKGLQDSQKALGDTRSAYLELGAGSKALASQVESDSARIVKSSESTALAVRDAASQAAAAIASAGGTGGGGGSGFTAAASSAGDDALGGVKLLSNTLIAGGAGGGGGASGGKGPAVPPPDDAAYLKKLDEVTSKTGDFVKRLVTAFAGLAVQGAAIAAAIGPAIAALGALGSVILGAAGSVANVVPLLGLIPAVLATGALAMSAFAVATHGVVGALKDYATEVSSAHADALELQKQQLDYSRTVQDSTEGLAKSLRSNVSDQIEAVRGLQGAQTTLSRSATDQSRTLQDSAVRVQNADFGLSSAQYDAVKAQADLNDARKQAVRTLQDLRAEVDKGKIDQEQAAADVQSAIEAYNNVLGDPAATSAAKAQSLAKLHAAQQNVGEVQVQNTRAIQDYNEAQQKGVSGSDGVIAAQKAQVQAQFSLRDAIIEETRSHQDQGRAQQDTAQKSIDDVQAVTKAYNQLENVTNPVLNGIGDQLKQMARAQADYELQVQHGTSSQSAFNDALSKLSPNARAFVVALTDLHGAYHDLQQSAQDSFFKPLLGTLPQLASALPDIKDNITKVAGALGDVVAKILTFVTSPAMKPFFDALADATVALLKLGGETVVQGLGAITDIIKIGVPFVTKFATTLKDLATNFKAFTSSADGQKTITDAFSQGEKTAGQFFTIVGNLVEAFGHLLHAAEPFINWMGDGLVKGTETFAKFAALQDSPGSGFTSYLEKIKPLLQELGKDALAFIKYLFGSANDQSNLNAALTVLQKIRTELGPAVAAFIKAVEDKDLLGHFIDALTSITNFLTALIAKTDGLKAFFEGVKNIFDGLKSLVDFLGKGVFDALLGALSLLVLRFTTLALLKFTGLLALLGVFKSVFALLLDGKVITALGYFLFFKTPEAASAFFDKFSKLLLLLKDVGVLGALKLLFSGKSADIKGGGGSEEGGKPVTVVPGGGPGGKGGGGEALPSQRIASAVFYVTEAIINVAGGSFGPGGKGGGGGPVSPQPRGPNGEPIETPIVGGRPIVEGPNFPKAPVLPPGESLEGRVFDSEGNEVPNAFGRSAGLAGGAGVAAEAGVAGGLLGRIGGGLKGAASTVGKTVGRFSGAASLIPFGLQVGQQLGAVPSFGKTGDDILNASSIGAIVGALTKLGGPEGALAGALGTAVYKGMTAVLEHFDKRTPIGKPTSVTQSALDALSDADVDQLSPEDEAQLTPKQDAAYLEQRHKQVQASVTALPRAKADAQSTSQQTDSENTDRNAPGNTTKVTDPKTGKIIGSVDAVGNFFPLDVSKQYDPNDILDPNNPANPNSLDNPLNPASSKYKKPGAAAAAQTASAVQQQSPGFVLNQFGQPVDALSGLPVDPTTGTPLGGTSPAGGGSSSFSGGGVQDPSGQMVQILTAILQVLSQGLAPFLSTAPQPQQQLSQQGYPSIPQVGGGQLYLNGYPGQDQSLGFNEGGQVPGEGNTDSVAAMLTPGEWVSDKETTRREGANSFAALAAGKARIVHFANGGMALAGGSPAPAYAPASVPFRGAPGSVLSLSSQHQQTALGPVARDIHIHNPIQEHASESAARTIRKLTYMGR